VRVWDNPSDLPGQPPFDASWNRHVAQRNIHVNAPGMTTGGALGLKPVGFALQKPILIKVGPLFGAPATVAVERVAPKHGALASTADRNPGSLSRDGDADRNAGAVASHHHGRRIPHHGRRGEPHRPWRRQARGIFHHRSGAGTGRGARLPRERNAGWGGLRGHTIVLLG
jgi:hypothetical protein